MRSGSSPAAVQLLVELHQPLAHLQRRAHRRARVELDALARGGDVAPDRHDRVSNELVQRAAVAQDAVDHLAEVGVELPHQLGFLDVLADLGVIADIGKKDGHRALVPAELERRRIGKQVVHHLRRQHARKHAAHFLPPARLRQPEPQAAHDLHAVVGRHRPRHRDLDAPRPKEREGQQRVDDHDRRRHAHAHGDARVAQPEEREPAHQQVTGDDPAPRHLVDVVVAQDVIDRVEVRVNQRRARLQRRGPDVGRHRAIDHLPDQHRLLVDVAAVGNRRVVLHELGE